MLFTVLRFNSKVMVNLYMITYFSINTIHSEKMKGCNILS